MLNLAGVHAMNTYGGVVTQLYLILISAPDAGEWSASRPGHRTPVKWALVTLNMGGTPSLTEHLKSTKASCSYSVSNAIYRSSRLQNSDYTDCTIAATGEETTVINRILVRKQ